MKNLYLFFVLLFLLIVGCTSNPTPQQQNNLLENASPIVEEKVTSATEVKIETPKDIKTDTDINTKNSEKIFVQQAKPTVEKKTEITKKNNLFLYPIIGSNKVLLPDIAAGKVYAASSSNNELIFAYKSSKDNGNIVLKRGEVNSVYCSDLSNVSFYAKDIATPIYSNSYADAKNLFIAILRDKDKLNFYDVNISSIEESNSQIILLNASKFEIKIVAKDVEYIVKEGGAIPFEITKDSFSAFISVRANSTKKFRPFFSGAIEIPSGTKILLISATDEKSTNINIQPLLLK